MQEVHMDKTYYITMIVDILRTWDIKKVKAMYYMILGSGE